MYAIRSYYEILGDNPDNEAIRIKADEIQRLIAENSAQAGGAEIPKLNDAAVTRITSYNVCYTKLLRCNVETPVKKKS